MTTEQTNRMAKLEAEGFAFLTQSERTELESLRELWRQECDSKFDFRKLNAGDWVKNNYTGETYLVINTSYLGAIAIKKVLVDDNEEWSKAGPPPKQEAQAAVRLDVATGWGEGKTIGETIAATINWASIHACAARLVSEAGPSGNPLFEFTGTRQALEALIRSYESNEDQIRHKISLIK